jgi:uncharacterized damage-inducible protein DinB
MMKKEIESIIRNLQNTLEGTPWFGRAVYELLNEIDESKTSVKPDNAEHSLLELLWHMNTWAEFTLKRLQKAKEPDLAATEELDWREIDPSVHTWKKGLAEYKKIHTQIIKELKTKDDELLKENLDNRDYNFRFLLNGLIQHNIYHIGQIAYIKKLVAV